MSVKTPAPPPEYRALQKRLLTDPERFFELLSAREAHDDYLPWDKIRYKTPPAGMTAEEWWFQLRTIRRASERHLPLAQKDGAPFTVALPDVVLKLHDDITRLASGNVQMAEPVTSQGTRTRYLTASLIEEAITSSQLEGASTTRRDARRMLLDRKPPHTRGERMIANNYAAMQRIVELSSTDMTPDLVKEIHRIVTDGTLADPTMAGRLQSDPDPADRVAVRDENDDILHAPPPVSELETRLQALCDFANGGGPSDPYLPPVVRAILVHFMAGYDHYFEDGNGRTARSLFYWALLRQGYWMAEYISISTILRKASSAYARSFLLTEQDEGDTTYFVIHHLEVLRRAIDQLHEYLDRKSTELGHAKQLMRTRAAEFSHRQIALIESALRDPSAEFTVNTHATRHAVTAPTARTDLKGLEQRGLLLSRRRGRQTVWRPVPKLAEQLELDVSDRTGLTSSDDG